MRSSPERSRASARRQASGAVDVDEVSRLEAKLDRARELVRAEEEKRAVDDDDALSGPLDRTRTHLDVRRRRVAARLVGDAPQRPATPSFEAACEIGSRVARQPELGRGVEALGQTLRMLAERVEVGGERSRPDAGSSS